MKISCITTVFNEGDLVRRSIGSILEQTHRDLELIVVDDGSADPTRRILESLSDPRILLIRQANDGLSAARNKALEQVTGEYVCFLDADDSRPPWALAAMAEVIERDRPDLVFCRGSVSQLSGMLAPFYDTPKIDRLVRLHAGRPIAGEGGRDPMTDALLHLLEPQVANKAVRTAFLKDRHLRFPNGHFFEDILFHTLAIGTAERISVLDTLCFTYFRRYQPQITMTRGETRFDVLGVARMTLDLFADLPAFRQPLPRAAALAGCAKLVRWCGNLIAHHHREAYRQVATALFRAIDGAYLDFPEEVPEGLDEIVAAWDYLSELGVLDPAAPRPRMEEVQHETPAHPGLLQRLWGQRRA